MAVQFQTRKQKILEQLAAPDESYHDLSPKGSVDAPIRGLIGEINGFEGLVTTSSCSGRISVFLEGRKTDANGTKAEEEMPAGPGGKGGGGQWLYISHDPLTTLKKGDNELMTSFGLSEDEFANETPDSKSRYIHLKFEPMILHISTASLEECQRVLTAAFSAGFRESGAMSLTPSRTGELNPMVAVRSTGYSYDSVIGFQNDSGENVALVNEQYLRTMVDIANERFHINTERIARFRKALHEQYCPRLAESPNGTVSEWEDAEARRRRKREEGLARQQSLKVQNQTDTANSKHEPAIESAITAMFDQ